LLLAFFFISADMMIFYMALRGDRRFMRLLAEGKHVQGHVVEVQQGGPRTPDACSAVVSFIDSSGRERFANSAMFDRKDAERCRQWNGNRTAVDVLYLSDEPGVFKFYPAQGLPVQALVTNLWLEG
jgi:hypothetical protein